MPFAKSLSWISLVLFTQAAVCQTTGSTLAAASCNPGSPLKTFSACNWLDGQINYCAGPQVATGAPFVSCYCNQKVFDAIYDCESEYRLCFGNHDMDGDEQAVLSVWNSACDNIITFSPTTPVLSTLTSTYDVQYCTTAYSACAAAAAGHQLCSVSYLGKDVQEFSSCFCAPPILSEAFTCGFLGNVSCLQAPATLTNLPEYPLCDNFMQVLGSVGSGSLTSAAPPSSISNSSPSLLTSVESSYSSQSSFTITTPALPGSSSGTAGPAPTSATSLGQAGQLDAHFLTRLGSLVIAVVVVL